MLFTSTVGVTCKNNRLLEVDPAFSISRLGEYLGPYQRPEFAEKYAEGLRRAGLPEVSVTTSDR